MGQEIQSKNMKNLANLFRSPTLDTVLMVERACEEYSGTYKKTQLWEKLPRKVMWSTFTTILDYLESINKIVMSEEGIITYIWNPSLYNKLKSRKSY